MKMKKLSKKGKYMIPCTVMIITFPINYKQFKKEKEYYADFRLIIL